MNFSEARMQEEQQFTTAGGTAFNAEVRNVASVAPSAADRLQRLLDRLARPAALTGADLRRAFGPRFR